VSVAFLITCSFIKKFWNFKIEKSELAGDMAREWYKLNTRSLRSHADVGSAIGLILKVFASGL
jgi:hypothetical protein